MSFQDFQKAPNRFTSSEILFLVSAVIILFIVVFVLALGNYSLAKILPDGGEFYLLRTGARSFLYDHIEPYSGTIPTLVQEQVYGRAALPGEDIYILDIPFHLMLIYFPLALFPDALIARAFWMALTEISLVGMVFFGLRVLNRQTPFFINALIFIGCVTSFYTYQSLLEGSPTLLLALACVGIWLSLFSGLDELAGALAVLASFQWEISGPFILFVFLWVYWEKRWRFFAGVAMLGFLLFAISLFIYPGWFFPFLRASWNSIQVGYGFSVHGIVEQYWPMYGNLLGWGITIALIILLGYEWRATRGADFQRVIWAICLTVAATPLLGIPIEIDQLVFLTVPVILVVLIARERWRKIGFGIFLGLLLYFFGIPWFINVQGIPFKTKLTVEEITFLFWPISTFIGLYWIRWWMVRPPRTWLENFAGDNS